jgi:Condensin II complex subunit CAP-H2 or CNDH2, N-terminal
LDEYLEDLEFTQETREHIVQAASNTNANFNFAQAAIVLQNSSGIYSRKVDFLHSHVYKIQDDLFQAFHPSGSNNPKGSRKTSVGIDSEIEAFLNFDPHQEFLPLNDIIPVCSPTENGLSIDLSESVDVRNSSLHSRRSIGGDSIRLGVSSASRRQNRTSFGSTPFHADRTMMTEGDFMIGFASRRSLLSSVEATGTLRLQSGVCHIGDDGILRMPGSTMQEKKKVDLCNDSEQDLDMNDISFAAVGMTDDDDNDDNEGFVATGNDDEIVTMDVGAVQETKRRVTFADSSAVSSSREVSSAKPIEDPWSLLSWDTPDLRKPRPLRIGKTIVLPETVDKPPSECVTGARTRQSARIKTLRIPRKRLLQPSSNTSTDSFEAIVLGKKRSLEQNSTKSGLSYRLEFAYIAKATAQRRHEELRLQRRALDRSAFSDVIPPGAQDGTSKEILSDYGDPCFDDNVDDDFDHSAGGVFDSMDDSSPLESNTGISSIDDIYRIRSNEGGTFDCFDNSLYGVLHR